MEQAEFALEYRGTSRMQPGVLLEQTDVDIEYSETIKMRSRRQWIKMNGTCEKWNKQNVIWSTRKTSKYNQEFYGTGRM